MFYILLLFFAILWCTLIFKQEGKGSTKKVDVVAMELSAEASSPSMLARGMGEHRTVSPLVAVWQSHRNLGMEMSFSMSSIS